MYRYLSRGNIYGTIAPILSSLGSPNRLKEPGAVETENQLSATTLSQSFPGAKISLLPTVVIGSLTTFNKLMELLLNVRVQARRRAKILGF
jgi:hypothetical protein